ncbi:MULTISPECIES: hypothetical protein [unclassified Vibrio]|uniref:hypothetical protein n=1 Tax=unclassified Vibrio TaxID=2614977 RepID=UPI00126950DA|nr:MULTISPECIES: hypothetical protein [unclassified Vibrio]QFT40126.1 purine nucleoside phosphorylase [Vibrio sp. THAF64]QGM37949.1 purine nucleoside phosphorylase [Vibrio sp. THAF191d]QGN73470.1 purine nucleoside phosphorylase [Vibrio sp. THAF191c]
MVKLWIFTGCPNRAQAIAKIIDANAPSEPDIYQPFFSVWFASDIGVCACGMGRPSIDYAVRQLKGIYPVERAIRIGTAGTQDESLLGSLVAVSRACSREDSHTYPSFLFPNLPLTGCVTTDLLYTKSKPVDGFPVEDMETSQLLRLGQELGFEAGAILFVANRIGESAIVHRPYAVFDMVQAAISTLRG